MAAAILIGWGSEESEEPLARAPRASEESDPLENKLKRQVCDGLVRLATARAAIKAFKFKHG